MGGKVNRDLLESFYQNKGDFYDDEKTEGALETLADQIDANWEVSESNQTKLNTIAEGAEVNQNAFSKIKVAGQSDVDAGEKEDAFTIEAGVGIRVTVDSANKVVRFTATGTAVPALHGEEHNIGGSDPIPDLVQLSQESAQKFSAIDDSLVGSTIYTYKNSGGAL